MLLTLTDTYPPLPLHELTGIIAAFPQMTILEKKRVIERLVRVHPTLNFDWGPGRKYRRCRKLSSEELPLHVDELIWQKATPAKLGRANPEGYQVLYLADRRDTALAEARVNSDSVVIAEFVIQKEKNVRVAPIGELAQVQRTGRGFLAGEQSKAISELLKASSFENATSLLITDAFLRDCLVGHDDYDLSSHVALSIFSKHPEIAVVAYSSRRQSGAINFAVGVDRFWEAWALCSVSFGHASHLAMGYFSMATSKAVTGVSQDGRLTWEDLPPPNTTMLLDPPYTPTLKA